MRTQRSVYIDEELWKSARLHSIYLNITISDLICKAMSEFLLTAAPLRNSVTENVTAHVTVGSDEASAEVDPWAAPLPRNDGTPSFGVSHAVPKPLPKPKKARR